MSAAQYLLLSHHYELMLLSYITNCSFVLSVECVEFVQKHVCLSSSCGHYCHLLSDCLPALPLWQLEKTSYHCDCGHIPVMVFAFYDHLCSAS